MKRAAGIIGRVVLLASALGALASTAVLGATISGKVTDADTGTPLAGVLVVIWVQRDANRISQALTDSSGEYTIEGLNNRVFFAVTVNHLGYYDEIYDDIPCPLPTYRRICKPGPDAVPIDLSSGSAADIDFALDRRGTLSGRVTSSRGGSPIVGADVAVRDEFHNLAAFLKTDASGAYLAGGLVTGRYFVNVAAPDFVSETYDDIPCPTCSFVDATPVAVSDQAETSGIDFVLDPPSSITGTITDERTGDPVAHVSVMAQIIVGGHTNLDFRGSSDEEGGYVISGLSRGSYALQVYDQAGYVAELYDDQPCVSVSRMGCATGPATPVTVAADASVPGVDFALVRGGSIAGTVRESASGKGFHANVVAIRTDGTWRRDIQALNADGSYLIDSLAEGNYHVVATTPYGFRGEVFDDVACGESEESCDLAGGETLSIAPGDELTGIDFDLDLVRGIRGRITSEESGQPIAGVAVVLFGAATPSARSFADGSYFMGARAGRYFAATVNDQNLVDEIYDDIPCPDGVGRDACRDLRQGTPLDIGDTTVLEGVDFALKAKTCLPSSDALCLNDGRFRVSVTWRDFAGTRGNGHAWRLTPDSGYFWFFDSSNVELVVKVLDGCSQPSPAFWVFAAGLTNVETEITVTDTVTGDVKTYSKRPGEVFAPILDTSAFKTCSAKVAGAPSPMPEDSGLRGSIEPEDLRVGSGGRFQVEATWRTPSGETGFAQAVGLTNESGYFWFFGPDNVEVVVKVLDACDLVPFHKFWFFAAGLTNVEVRLRVTDTLTGRIKEYVNPLGSAFRPVLDTAAFDTCGAM